MRITYSVSTVTHHFSRITKCPTTVFNSIIFFDLDNTLIDGPFGTAVFPLVLYEIARKTNCDQKKIRRLIVKENSDRQNDPQCPAVKAMDWDDIFITVARRLGAETLEVDAAAIVRATAREHSALHDGAHEVLSQLRAPHRALVLATKGLIKYQRPILEALELDQFLDDVLTPDSHHALKKDRAFYGEWLRQTSEVAHTAKTSEVLMPARIIVGDHYVDDVLPPHQFGMLTIWKNEKIEDQLLKMNPFERSEHFEYADDQPVKPTAIIKSLHEVPDVIARLESATPDRSFYNLANVKLGKTCQV